MRTTRQRKERAFLFWGVPGALGAAIFAVSPLVEDPWLWSVGGLFVAGLCGMGYGLTREAIDRRRQD